MKPCVWHRFHRVESHPVIWDGMPAVTQKVIVLVRPDGSREPFVPFTKFVHDEQKERDFAWQMDAAFAVGNLIDFLVATRGRWTNHNRQDAFAAYARALTHGTFAEDRSDPTGLAWPAHQGDRARTILGYATRFADWLARVTQTQPLNGWRPGAVGELILEQRRRNNQSAHSLLFHLRKHRSAPSVVRETRIEKEWVGGESPAPMIFDTNRLHELIVRGFALSRRAAARSKYPFCVRNAMIAILYHAGGLRLAEPFHLWVNDVDDDPLQPGLARVRVYHPEQGALPDFEETYGLTLPDREAYLRSVWGMLPRTLGHGGLRASWKDLMLTDRRAKFAQVHWLPVEWGREFRELYIYYREECRPNAACRHPFLFACEQPRHLGRPYTVGAFRQAYALAVRRIGLVPAKELGTTPHGHRHAHGQALADGGADPRTIQRALHHKSIHSQEVYTRPPVSTMNRALQEANARLGNMFDMPSLTEGKADPHERALLLKKERSGR